jgi:hypothetical protein
MPNPCAYDQTAAWVEDCPGGGDASLGDDHLADGEVQRTLRLWRPVTADTSAPGSLSGKGLEYRIALCGIVDKGFFQAYRANE